MKYSLAELGQATNARIEYIDAATEFVTGIQTDSRKVVPGDLFVAIKGENFDGHDFIEDAVERGAVAVMVSSATEELSLLVEDTLVGLGKIAKYHRHNLNAKVIAITGSSGKTSTKDLLAATLEQFGETIAPAGSFNNEIGLPATILSAATTTKYLVLEMGMRGLGHIDYLCEISAPDVSALLNVGSAHIELLGSREAIAKAKGETFTRLKPNGKAILFADDHLVSSLGNQTIAQKITFGQSDVSDVKIQNLTLDQDAKPTFDVTFAGKTQSVSLNAVGEHQAFNAAAVIAICLALDLDFERVCEAVSKANPVSKWRMEVAELANGVTLVNDAYNANPESMRAGLKALKAMAGERRTWAVLGQMRELGLEADVAHDEIGRLCVRLDVNRLVAVGQGAKLIQMGASLEGSWSNESIFVETIDEALELLKSELKTGDIIYLKASRAIGLESVAQALTQWASGKNTHS